MHIVSWTRCKNFARAHPDSLSSLRFWRRIVKAARWPNPAEMKKALPSASIVGKSRTVFNIGGNKYRIIADVFYDRGRVLIRAILTHEEYDEVDVEKL